MKKSILTIEPVAKNYPTIDDSETAEVIARFYEVYDRAIVRGRGFVDRSEQAWFEQIDEYLSEGSGLQ